MDSSLQEGFQPIPDTEQEYKKQIKELEQQVRLLKEQADFLTRKLYGTKSEKTSAFEIAGQMSLFNEIESCAAPDVHEPDLVEVEKYLRKRKYAGQREKLIKDLPRSKVLHTIDESEQICERCGGAMVKVGEVPVSMTESSSRFCAAWMTPRLSSGGSWLSWDTAARRFPMSSRAAGRARPIITSTGCTMPPCSALLPIQKQACVWLRFSAAYAPLSA